MSSLAQSNIVQYLTDYAYGIGGESIDPTAQLLAPITQVASPVGKYKKFDDKNAFQTPATDRALGGPARRLEFAAVLPEFLRHLDRDHRHRGLAVPG